MKIILCRRILNPFDSAPPQYCAKPLDLKAANSLNWCSACAERLPFWPTDKALREEQDPALKAYARALETANPLRDAAPIMRGGELSLF